MYRILIYQYSDVSLAIFGKDTKHLKDILRACGAIWHNDIINEFSNARLKANRKGGWLLNVNNKDDLMLEFQAHRILTINK